MKLLELIGTMGLCLLCVACAQGSEQPVVLDDDGVGGLNANGAGGQGGAPSAMSASQSSSNTGGASGGNAPATGGNGGVGGANIGGDSAGGAGGQLTPVGGGGFGGTQVVEVGPSLSLSITSNSYDGTKASMLCSNIVVPSDAINVVNEVTLEVGIDHDWVGDLTVKLFSPASTGVTLMSMPGESRAADNGSGLSLEGSDLAGSSPILFIANAADNAEDMGNTISSSEVICQDDGICEYAPNHGSAAASALSDFQGEASNGTWELCVGDSAASNSGTLQSATLSITK